MIATIQYYQSYMMTMTVMMMISVAFDVVIMYLVNACLCILRVNTMLMCNTSARRKTRTS